jgi:hypothetical protein
MWQEEQANILATIEKHKDANTNDYGLNLPFANPTTAKHS